MRKMRRYRTLTLAPVLTLLLANPVLSSGWGKAQQGGTAPGLERGARNLAASTPNAYQRSVTDNPRSGAESMSLNLTSTAFIQGGEIPSRYTCDGADISPQLAWSGLPEGTRSLVFIIDDPDAPDPAAPRMTWVHWVLYNIPTESDGLPEAVAPQQLPAGTLQGLNDWKRSGYGGPCPPIGRHRYFHKLYALDTRLPDLRTPTKKQLEKAMQGHILGHVELIGTYRRKR